MEQARAQFRFEASQPAAHQHWRYAHLTSRGRQTAEGHDSAKQSHICQVHFLTLGDKVLIVQPIFSVFQRNVKSKLTGGNPLPLG
jgi:hypothetical protein